MFIYFLLFVFSHYSSGYPTGHGKDLNLSNKFYLIYGPFLAQTFKTGTKLSWDWHLPWSRQREFQASKYTRIHAVWATMPASAALGINQLVDIPFSTGAHAYDVFRNGGDWLLPLKIKLAISFVHLPNLPPDD